MRTIWKYDIPINSEITISMPHYHIVLDIQPSLANPNVISMWVEVDTESKLEDTKFSLYGTGHPMQEPYGAYIGTFQCSIDHSVLVFHLFENYG